MDGDAVSTLSGSLTLACRSAQIVGDSHVVYVIEVVKEGLRWEVLRRFSEFAKLHKNLKEMFGSKGLPSLPPKKIRMGHSKFRRDFVESRREGLNNYMATIAGMFDPERVDTLNDFLEFSENFLLGTTKNLEGITELRQVTALLQQAVSNSLIQRRGSAMPTAMGPGAMLSSPPADPEPGSSTTSGAGVRAGAGGLPAATASSHHVSDGDAHPHSAAQRLAASSGLGERSQSAAARGGGSGGGGPWGPARPGAASSPAAAGNPWGAPSRSSSLGADSDDSDADSDGPPVPSPAPLLPDSGPVSPSDIQSALASALEQLEKYLLNLQSQTEDLEAEYDVKVTVQETLKSQLTAKRQDLDDARSVARAERRRLKADCAHEKTHKQLVETKIQLLRREVVVVAHELKSLRRRQQHHNQFVQRFANAIESVRTQQLLLLGVGSDGVPAAAAEGGGGPSADLASAREDSGPMLSVSAAPTPQQSVSPSSSPSLSHRPLSMPPALPTSRRSNTSDSGGGRATSSGGGGGGGGGSGGGSSTGRPAASSFPSNHRRAASSSSTSSSHEGSALRAGIPTSLVAKAARETGVAVLPVRAVRGARGDVALEALVVEEPKTGAAVSVKRRAASSSSASSSMVWNMIEGICEADEAPERAALRVFREKAVLMGDDPSLAATIDAARVAGSFGSREDPVTVHGSQVGTRHCDLMLVVVPPDTRAGVFAGASGATARVDSHSWLSVKSRWVSLAGLQDLRFVDDQSPLFVSVGLQMVQNNLEEHKAVLLKEPAPPTPVSAVDHEDDVQVEGVHGDVHDSDDSDDEGGDDVEDGDDSVDDSGSSDVDLDDVLVATARDDPMSRAGVGMLEQDGEMSRALTSAATMFDALQVAADELVGASVADVDAQPSVPTLQELRSSIAKLPLALVSGPNLDVLALLESAMRANLSLLNKFRKWRWGKKGAAATAARNTRTLNPFGSRSDSGADDDSVGGERQLLSGEPAPPSGNPFGSGNSLADSLDNESTSSRTSRRKSTGGGGGGNPWGSPAPSGGPASSPPPAASGNPWSLPPTSPERDTSRRSRGSHRSNGSRRSGGIASYSSGASY